MIRTARSDDMSEMMRLSRALLSESLTMKGIAIDEGKLTALYKRAFDASDPFVSLFVFERGGVIEGAMLGIVSEYYFSRERCASDLFLYVAPECRRGLLGGKIARRLVERFVDWARQQGVREIRTGVSTGVAVEAAHRFYQSMGMTHLGGMYTLAA